MRLKAVFGVGAVMLVAFFAIEGARTDSGARVFVESAVIENQAFIDSAL